MEPHHNIASLIVKYIQTFRELKSLFTDSKILRIFELTVGGFLHLKILLNYFQILVQLYFQEVVSQGWGGE